MVLLEDLGALLGLMLALVGVTLAMVTGDARFDAMGSLAIGVLLAVVTIPMLILAAPALAAHFILRDTTKAAAFIFVPLPLVCWLTGLSGTLIVYSIALPCLVGFTHFLRTKQHARSRIILD